MNSLGLNKYYFVLVESKMVLDYGELDRVIILLYDQHRCLKNIYEMFCVLHFVVFLHGRQKKKNNQLQLIFITYF